MNFCFFYSFIIFTLVISNLSNKNKIKGGTLKNIYNQQLQPCGNSNMEYGSWDNNYKCSELDGGVHQICIKNMKKNVPDFSSKTSQSNWSNNKKKNHNHCVCLGAWSLYNNKIKKNKKKILKCDSIPKQSLSKKYISKFTEGWNKWNGFEVDNQIIDGVNSLVNNCITDNKIKNKNLIQNYCSFSKNITPIKKTKLYKKYCK